MPPKSLFPAASIKDARPLPDTIAHSNAGQPMRRLDLFEVLGKAPDSGPSRVLVTSSNSYGLTIGGYQAEVLTLTPLGRRLSVEGDDTALIDAVLNVHLFKVFFDNYKQSSLPADVSAKSFLANSGVPAARTQACWDMLLDNGRYVGLIDKLTGGGERVLSKEHAIERKFGKSAPPPETPAGQTPSKLVNTSQEIKTKIPTGMPSLNINLEIHLPADTRPEVYDAIFGSMRKHLIDVE
jgi:hypothetical protein